MELSESGTFAVGRCAKSWCKELKFKLQHSDMLKLEIFLKKWTSNINLGAISQRNWSRIKANQFPVPLLVSLQQLNQNKEQISVGLGSFFMTIVPVQSLKGEVQDLSLFSFLSRHFSNTHIQVSIGPGSFFMIKSQCSSIQKLKGRGEVLDATPCSFFSRHLSHTHITLKKGDRNAA